MKEKVIAIMYDFDKTLCTKDSQEFSFIPLVEETPLSFWHKADELHYHNNMDQVLTYMYLMLKTARDHKIKLTKELLESLGNNIEFYPGVLSWFDRINSYGEKNGLKIEHYIISSGLEEMIYSSKIGKYFTGIYASSFYYDENSEAVWPRIAINYTNKTQFLNRISKGISNVSDDKSLNKKILDSERRINFNNMIYIGDGLTDVPCMKIVKENRGISIAVYTDKSKDIAKSLSDDGRINYMAKANYEKDSELELFVKKSIDAIKINNELQELEQINEI